MICMLLYIKLEVFHFFTEFQTPEEFFLGESAVKFNWMSVDPGCILKSEDDTVKKKEYHSKVINPFCPVD